MKSAVVPFSYKTFTTVTLILLQVGFCFCNLDYVCWRGKEQ